MNGTPSTNKSSAWLTWRSCRSWGIPSILAIVPVLLLVSAFSLNLAVEHAGSENRENRFLYLPSGKQMDLASLGHNGFVASILWVQGMFYYADGMAGGESLALFPRILEVVTDLDSSWEYPYLFAGLVLTDNGGNTSRKAIQFMERGVERFPDSWRMRLFLAMALMEHDSDYAAASEVLLPITRQGSSMKEMPEYVRTIAFTLLTKAGKLDAAVSSLLQSYELMADPYIREQLGEKLKKLVTDDIARERGTAGLAAIGKGCDLLLELLDSRDPAMRTLAVQVWRDLADPSRRSDALVVVADIVRQYDQFQMAHADGGK